MSPRAHLVLRITAIAVILAAGLTPRGTAQTAKASAPAKTQVAGPAKAPPSAVAQS